MDTVGNDSCELVIRDKAPLPVVPEKVRELLDQLATARQSYFRVRWSQVEYLEVILSRRSAAVIYVRHGDEYLCLNASRLPVESNERTVFQIETEPTPLPKNMRLSHAEAREIIEEFCRSRRLPRNVHWIRDGEKHATSNAGLREYWSSGG